MMRYIAGRIALLNGFSIMSSLNSICALVSIKHEESSMDLRET